MSLRCLFIVCLNDNKLLFHNLFRTVESRWLKKHPEHFGLKLPQDEDLVKSLLNELGILNSSTFQYSRDSCKKNFHAPLFWVPYSGSSHFWPVLIIECKNKLLCGVPFLDNIHPFQKTPSLAASRCADIAVVLELLLSLVHYVELPVSRLDDELKRRILHHLPFGRPLSHFGSVDGLQTASAKTSWLRSKPKLDIKITEEVRLSASKKATLCEIHGTVLINSETDTHSNGVKLQVHFQQSKNFPEILYHSCVTSEPEKEMYKITIKHLPDRTFTLLHYSFKLNDPPITVVFKVSNVTETKRALYVQLLLSSDVLKLLRLNRLEVRMPIPQGNRVNRITSASCNPVGTFALLKDGTQLSWSIISQTSSSASSANLKVKDELMLNAEIEMEKPNISLRNTFVTVMFSATGSTLSDIKFALQQPSDFKLNQRSLFKSDPHYRSWNDDADEII